MSKINAVRLVNLNYNNNTIRVSDETFHFNGESTLISLRNGGGKSVLVQMMMAPFIHKRYRDAKDRTFESYFTTNKPTFIMVEWSLDHGAGYVMTGMMVRKNQNAAGDNELPEGELEVVHFISEYQGRCMQDIHHLPVVEKGKNQMTLKNFGACRQLFESFKKDRSIRFLYYDMGIQAQQRQYFDKLLEYQIYYKEWETIIKKINLKESGLSELFSDCRDEKGLVEKWLLDAVESKLNKEKNRMKEFESIIEKYVGQYMENKSKIERRDTIKRFKEEAGRIMEAAAAYQDADGLVLLFENQIAGFMGELVRLGGEEEERLKDLCLEMEEIKGKRAYLEYEELSGGYYELKEQERFHLGNIEMMEAERDALEAECGKIGSKIRLLQCAKQQEAADESRLEYLEAKARLEVSRQKEVDLEPERQSVGYTLKLYYQGRVKEWNQRQQENEQAGREISEKIDAGRMQIQKLQELLLEETKAIAGQKVRVESFDEREERFNRIYGELFVRNIMGEYEPGMLEIWKAAGHKNLELMERERMDVKKKLDTSGEERKRLQRNLEDKKQEQMRLKMEQQEALRVKAEYEKELVKRKKILKYLELKESDILDTELILSAAFKKLSEIERIRRDIEIEEEQKKKEYVRLTQGKVLELPEEFEAMLKELGLNQVYGMEWLKKNGYTKEENQELVGRYPFLPYALLLSEKDLDKLLLHMQKEDTKVYTSFPIPMILREELKQGKGGEEGGVIAFQDVRFYISFNRNLLDEEQLARMAAKKEAQIAKLCRAAEQKKTEYADYFEKQEYIKNQKVTMQGLDENRENLEQLTWDLENMEERILEIEESALQLEILQKELQEQLMKLDPRIEKLMEKLVELVKFAEAYEAYLKDKQELARHEKKELRFKEQLKLQSELLLKRQSELGTLENEFWDIIRKQETYNEKCGRFSEYAETKCAKGEPEELEARYQAITAKMSKECQELERRAEECRKKMEKTLADIRYLAEKYHMDDCAWKDTAYNRKEEQHQESLLEDRQKKLKTKDIQWNEVDKAIAVLRQQIAEQMKKLRERCQKAEPLAKTDIKTQDFKAAINKLIYEEQEKKKQEDAVGQKINGYESNLTSLAEYSHLVSAEVVVWERDFSSMTRKELYTFKGTLIRDYRSQTEKRRECRNALEQLLARVLRMEDFQDGFYRKPLERLMELTKDAGQVMAQLNTTVMSFDSLMEKLEVDISVIEKEKERIAELLEDYIREVHDNLGKIDHNSTITVRERQVKMLKIKLDDWVEHEAVYKVRIQDFIDELTQKGLLIFESNENAQEYFGTRMTTRSLYDTVVGIGNVQIRLYKIEAMREYPITWAEVAKNSGGEGFLSAFVILTSLLYYMRRDDSDIFADRNEGKVLIMDNPFAQTNAAHLLKPLMDMAKKTNTQLICLTGLGGESIYNRFDNIYVLNLIAAGLRSGMQYLRTEHTKGTEEETVTASQIEVVAQELLF